MTSPRDFTGFRRALLRALPGEQAIGDWRPTAGDLGLQVLEWWAYLADVLTFYNEQIANESYLRTATQPGSLANLVALIGYAPAPGIAATGQVAVTRSASHPNEPLVIPPGMRLSSVPTPGVPAQTFEVGGTAAASFSGPSSIGVVVPPDPDLTVNSDGTPKSVLLAGKLTGVKPGDELLLVGSGFAGGDDNWSLVTVGTLTPQPDPDTGVVNTLVTFSAGGWGPTTPAAVVSEIEGATPHVERAYAVTAEHSGGYIWRPFQPSPQPLLAARQWADYRLMRPVAAAALWNQVKSSSSQKVISGASGGGLTVHLSAAVRGIRPGDVVLFDGGASSASALGVVTGVAEQFWSVPYPPPVPPKVNPPDIAVAHTVLTVALAGDDATTLKAMKAGQVAVRYGYKAVGTIIGVPWPELDSLPATVGVPDSYQSPASPATAMLVDSTGAGVLVTVSAGASGQVSLDGAGSPQAVISATVPLLPPLLPPLQLLLDLVPVSRGSTVAGEVLGSGNAALTNQSFTLAKSPLTYLAAGDGSVAALAVYVDKIKWQEVRSFYDQPADAKVYVVTRSPDQAVTTITFGDGENGARLTSGAGNVTATYRYGSGAASPPAGRLTTISQPQPNLASVRNPVAVSGGNDPQAPADVRVNAPASVFTFGRAISAIDYEVVAAQAPGVRRVTAYWSFDGTEQRALVTLYVGDDQAAVGSATNTLAGSDDPNRPVLVLPATPIGLTLGCTLVVAADRQVNDVKSAATAALCDPAAGLFSPGRMRIGQRLYVSAVDAALSVDGVLGVHNLTIATVAGTQENGDVFDPGEGSFFDLQSANVKIIGVNAGD